MRKPGWDVVVKQFQRHTHRFQQTEVGVRIKCSHQHDWFQARVHSDNQVECPACGNLFSEAEVAEALKRVA